ncbi:unnamed protein product [Rotaria socialis]|uniref:Uncharacterized protein n=1 Tax=Rotaria socialis TaxID=392032 RepID=A0A818CQS5_9BILA|nr:unnamed protein product [Rotaria socialis]CAF4504400.1 unnamed protein product [Rotaria socialis]CAF4537370.1 unnamed protein product [Rotaria socialis]CAF4855893.1 unnamed protein product [Rotaria socialis]
MISQYGDIVSNSVVAILKHDPRRAIFITEKLVGQQLKIREFAAAVTRGKNELKLTDASITPVTHFIENAVIENFVTEIVSLESKQSGIDTQHARELMSDPVIFLRKLIGEVYIVLQLVIYRINFFMINWNTQYIEHVAKGIPYLICNRHMRKIFLEELCLLHTADAEAAFVHLALKNEDSKYIPAMRERFDQAKPVSIEQNNNIQMPNKQKTSIFRNHQCQRYFIKISDTF